MPHRAGAGCITHVRPKSLYFPCTRTTRNVGLAFGRSPCTKHLQVIVLGTRPAVRDARGVQQFTPRNEEVNNQPTLVIIMLHLARSTPPDRFFGLSAGGPWLHVCYSCTWPRLARPPLVRVALGLEAAQRPCRFLTSSDALGAVQ